MESRHWTEERTARATLIAQIGIGYTVKTVELDRGHWNGPEIHEISSTGIITVYNKRSGKMVTQLIARPGQIRRYYPEGEAPKELLRLARYHQELAYNLT
jgi:hypothetical protein